MTTHTINGNVFRDDSENNRLSIGPATLSIIVPDGLASFSYDYESGGAAQQMSIRDSQFQNIVIETGVERFSAFSLDNSDDEIFDVTWGDNSRSILLQFYDNDTNTGYRFELAGDPLPPFPDVAAEEAFENSIISVTKVPSDSSLAAPNTQIPFASLLNVVTTENDIILGTNSADDLTGGIGDDSMNGLGGDDVLDGGPGNDYLRGENGNDTINPGSGSDFVEGGNGFDTIDLSDHDPNGDGFVTLSYRDLSAGVTVNVDASANTMTVDKGANGSDTIIDIINPLTSSWISGGWEVMGNAHDDTFNITTSARTFSQVAGGEGNDTFNLSTTDGIIRIDYSRGVNFEQPDSGITVDLGAGIVSNDGFGFTDTVNMTSTGRHGLEIKATALTDSITGSDRNERFTLLGGDDTLDGGGGIDLVRYDRQEILTGVTVDLADGTATGVWDGEAFFHTLSNIEDVRGAHEGEDMLFGDSGANEISARGGDDFLDGRGGNDFLYGQEGNDRLEGGDDNDSLFGGTGNDTLRGDDGNDNLRGEEGDDVLSGSTGNDVVNGGDGRDVMFGGSGDDLMFGGAGFDRMFGGSGTDRMFGGNANDIANGGSDNDIINTGAGNDLIFAQNGNDLVFAQAGNDTVFGGIGNDSVFGGAGNDTINVGAGNDKVFGGAGIDTITGAAGDDTLSGGGDSDVFVFAADQGDDTITDYTGVDRLDILAFRVTDGGGSDQDWRGAATSVGSSGGGSDVTIAWDGGGSLTLENTLMANLTDDDFLF